MKTLKVRTILIVIIQLRLFGSTVFTLSSQIDKECSCSLLSTVSKVKCSLQSTNSSDSTTCSLLFEQANGDFDKLHTKCVGRNKFSTVGEYTGPPRKIILHCKANFPLQLNFDGMLPHESIGVSNYRYIKNANGEFVNQSVLITSMNIEPEITGRYTITRMVNGLKIEVVSFYIFAENGENGPFLLNYGKILLPHHINDTLLVLPCRTFSSKVEVILRKESKRVTHFKYYDPTLGFVFEKSNGNFELQNGLYECYPNVIPTSAIDDLVVKINVTRKRDISTNENNVMGHEQRQGLNLNVSRNWVSCTGDEKRRRDYRLVNMRSRNPMESELKKLCFIGNEECVGKREGSSNRCYLSSQYCKSVDFKEGGGIISCFSRNSKSFKEPHQYILGLDGNAYLNPRVKELPTEALFKIDLQGKTEFYTDIPYEVSCQGTRYLLAQPLMIHIKMRNGTSVLVNQEKIVDDDVFSETYDISSSKVVFNNYKSEVTTRFTSEVEFITCSAFVWDSNEIVKMQIPLNIQRSVKPNFYVKKAKITFFLGQTHELNCDYESLPEPKISWEKDGEKIPLAENKNLVVSNVTYKSAGAYLCKVNNELGTATKTFLVEVEVLHSGPSHWLTIGIPITLTIIITLIFLILLRHYRKTNKGLSKEEIKEFMKGISDPAAVHADDNYYENVVSAMPYSMDYEIMDGKFALDETFLLGSGAYGMVYKGTIGNLDVAVKTLKRNADVAYLRSLLTELKVMIYLQKHDHIVNLVGANTRHLSRGLVYVMVELCPLGSLESYLRNNRNNFTDLFCVSDYSNKPDVDNCMSPENNFTTENLLRWSIQISSAMEYLASKKVIHGDLAARNVLLQSLDTAKVSDFGLSRKLYEYSDYVKKSSEPLPWRHMALESLKDMQFSSQSDVWAFGITLWEIFSLGEVPYPGQSWNVDFVHNLENGLRMRKAKYSDENLFNIQIDCWNNDPLRRPTFAELTSELRKIVCCPVTSM